MFFKAAITNFTLIRKKKLHLLKKEVVTISLINTFLNHLLFYFADSVLLLNFKNGTPRPHFWKEEVITMQICIFLYLSVAQFVKNPYLLHVKTLCSNYKLFIFKQKLYFAVIFVVKRKRNVQNGIFLLNIIKYIHNQNINEWNFLKKLPKKT